MGLNDSVDDKTGETAAELQGPAKSTGIENVTTMIADEMHHVGDALGERAAGQDAQSGITHVARYGKQASEWLNRSAEAVRQFDYKQANARVREYVRQSPGRSLLIAGAAGLIIGAIFRRR